MNSDQNASSTGQDLKPARAPQPKGNRLLSVVHGKDERSLHLSPILQQIKDDGPALIDGEVLKEASAAPRIAKTASEAKGNAAPAPTAQPLFADKQVKILLGFCAALALGLCASLYFSWQQQQRLANVEYMLEVLVTSPR
ncbi:MAG TPA: hypothetical protein VGE69_07705 [Pseudomonadales bacterium]